MKSLFSLQKKTHIVAPLQMVDHCDNGNNGSTDSSFIKQPPNDSTTNDPPTPPPIRSNPQAVQLKLNTANLITANNTTTPSKNQLAVSTASPSSVAVPAAICTITPPTPPTNNGEINDSNSRHHHDRRHQPSRQNNSEDKQYQNQQDQGLHHIASKSSSTPYRSDPIEILPGLWLGSERNARNRQTLYRHRITHIVNVGIECRSYFAANSADVETQHRQQRSRLALSPSSPSSAQSSSSMKSMKSGDIESPLRSAGAICDSLPTSPIYNPLNLQQHQQTPSSSAYSPLTPSPLSSNSSLPKSPVSQGCGGGSGLQLPRMERLSIDNIDTLDCSTEEFVVTEKDSSILSPIEYLKLPFTHHQSDICDYFTEAFDFIDRGRGIIPTQKDKVTTTSSINDFNDLITKCGTGVLVHCKQGVSRSATIIIGYVMRTKKMRFQQAYDFVKRKSPPISPNLELVYQLMDYEKILFNNE